MRVLIVAHFGPNLPFGGSQRTTTIAERLRDRGATIEWVTVEGTTPSTARKLTTTLRLKPIMTEFHARPMPEIEGQSYEAAIAVHSYMAHYLTSVESKVRAVDFQNLEWRYTSEIAALSPPGKRQYRKLQAQITRKYEKELLRSETHGLLATTDELAWASAIAPGRRHLWTPNLLPNRQVDKALAIGQDRKSSPPHRSYLLHFGTLTYPPNELSLSKFLSTAWAAARSVSPNLALHVAGRAAPRLVDQLRGTPGVHYHGFVEDLSELLRGAAAVVLPVSAGGGSSMRVPMLALAQIPVIATPRAARDWEEVPTVTVSAPQDWPEALAACWGGDFDGESIQAAKDHVLARHSNSTPWDLLYDVLQSPLN